MEQLLSFSPSPSRRDCLQVATQERLGGPAGFSLSDAVGICTREAAGCCNEVHSGSGSVCAGRSPAEHGGSWHLPKLWGSGDAERDVAKDSRWERGGWTAGAAAHCGKVPFLTRIQTNVDGELWQGKIPA